MKWKRSERNRNLGEWQAFMKNLIGCIPPSGTCYCSSRCTDVPMLVMCGVGLQFFRIFNCV